MNLFTILVLSTVLSQAPSSQPIALLPIDSTLVLSARETDIDNEQKVPLTIEGQSRNNRPAEIFGPITFTVNPSAAGIVDNSNFFIPTDGFEGQVTVIVEALNRKSEVITGQIVFTVSNAPAIAILVTAGTPIDK